MKPRFLIYALTIAEVMLFLFTGCKKEEKKPDNIVTDIVGNDYLTVMIGSQVWMAENLRTTKYNNSEIIPNVINNTLWSNLSDGAYCTYENSEKYVKPYGRLYNWYSVNDVRNLCPAGWHVPTDADWAELITFLGGDNIAGGKLKETGETHWSGNISTNNENGFSGLPGGFRDGNGFFGNIGEVGFWWSSTEQDSISAGYKSMASWSESIYSGTYHKKYGSSIRCIKD
jgi:uncharacterized protein (TIGR02145 family)